MSEIQDVLSSHPDYEQIGQEEYMELWDGGNPLFNMQCETDEPGGCHAFVDVVEDDAFVADVSGHADGSHLSLHYRITPSEGIETSLSVFENVGFEHVTTDPPDPTEAPFQAVFDAIEQAGSDADSETEQREVFDGSYQCRWCGRVRQIGTFAGAATSPKKVGTDCENCGGERRFDAIYPDADSVRHRWAVSFEDIQRDPYRIEVTAKSRVDARKKAQADYPDRTIEIVGHEERIDDE